MKLKVQRLSEDAVIPFLKKEHFPYYSLFSPCSIRLPPNELSIISLDIAIEIPEGFYGQILHSEKINMIDSHITTLPKIITSSGPKVLSVNLFNSNLPANLFYDSDSVQNIYDSVFPSDSHISITKGVEIANLVIHKNNKAAIEEVEFDEKYLTNSLQ